MALTDEELFDFDRKRLADFDIRPARRLLEEQGDVYRAQLVAAKWIDYWREGVLGMSGPAAPRHSEDWNEGFEYAMRETAAHLRQGDLVPGGVLHDETLSGKLR